MEESNSEVTVCSECEGGGMTMKLYPNGPCEVTCESCDGDGYIEE